MRNPTATLLLAPLIAVIPLARPATPLAPAAPSALDDATSRELAAIREKVARATAKLGEKAGLPEVPDKFQPIPPDARWLTAAEAKHAFAKAPAKLETLRWWKIGLDPTKLDHALREPASVVSCGVHAQGAGLDGGERALALAREAADFLIWAQTQGGTGVFPFPASTGKENDRAFAAAAGFLKKAAQAGKLDEFVHNGWIVDDHGDGGLQFDNGEAGVALLELYEVSHAPSYLESARKAADWAFARPLSPNWNYNSFSVYLLAKFFAVTHEAKYLTAAIDKARVGVIPGQLTDGPRAGRWLDAHNARPAYHYIMMRALAELATVLPNESPERIEVMRALRLGLRARNQDFLGVGAPNEDKAMEVLVFVNRRFAEEKDFLRETLSVESLDALAKLVSSQSLRGRDPLGPREWSLFLEYVATRATPESPPKAAPDQTSSVPAARRR